MSWGYRPTHTLLRRESWKVGHNLARRLYREGGFLLRRSRRKRSWIAIQPDEIPI